MLLKPLALGLLAATCVVAAAGGAYVATRQMGAGVQPPPAPDVAGPRDLTSPVSGSPAPAEADRPAAQPGGRAEASATDATPTRVAAAPRPARQSVPAAAGAETAPSPSAETRPPIARPDDGGAPPGSDAQPVLSPDTWNTAATPDAAAAQVEVLGPAEDTQGADSQQTPPPGQTFRELTVPADAVLGLQLETPLSSERAQMEDRVDAKVTRDVRVGDRVAIPAGTRVIGSVVRVARGGKVKERASLSVKFHTIVLSDSTELAITTDIVSRESGSFASKSAAKIGGAAVGGAILGGILGGGRGAAIGGSLGAAGGATAVMAGDRAAVVLPSGTLLTVRMLSPITVNVEK
jgi:hypothetical protein